MRNRRKVILLMLLILTVAMMPFGPGTEVSFAGTTVKVAVVDTDKKMAYKMIRYLKKAGIKGVWEHSKAVDPAKYDGMVIPGGGDVHPSMYNAKRGKYTYGCSKKKDRLQIAAIMKFAEAEKPILGVCRGAQIINVAYGGTLKQHINAHWGKARIKVKVKKKSWLYGMFGSSETVICYHHQCCKKLGKNLIATQISKKGKRIEEIRHKTLPIYGIQFHPEYMGKKGVRIMKRFGNICKKYRNHKPATKTETTTAATQ